MNNYPKSPTHRFKAGQGRYGGKLHRRHPRPEAVEHIGSGIQRIRNLCRDYGVAEPKIEVSEHWFSVIFPRTEFPEDGGQAKTQTNSGRAQAEAQEAQVIAHEAQVLAGELQDWEYSLLGVCARHDATGAALLEAAGYSSRTGNFKRGLEKLLTLGLLRMTIPDKPRSSKQRYRLTAKGRSVLDAWEQQR